MKLSARNQLKGTIKEIETGAVNAVIKLDIGGGNIISATISMDAVKSLNKERLKALHPERCIECGLCAYACTSKINVTDYIRRAKLLAK